MIASGISPREAIATATLPVNTTRESVGYPASTSRPRTT